MSGSQAKAARREGGLSPREREVLGLLSEGLSGARIAEQLFLSPETVRTHVRNAMAKLGATTRSQAVALALQRAEIGDRPAVEPGAAEGGRDRAAGAADPRPRSHDPSPARRGKALASSLDSVLVELASLYDVEGGAIFLVEDDGLTLSRIAYVDNKGSGPLDDESKLALGEGPLGRAALSRRAQVVRLPRPGTGLTAVAAPMHRGRSLVGLLCLTARASRPLGRNELLMLQAFASRVAEVIVMGGGEASAGRLREILDGFRSSWSA